MSLAAVGYNQPIPTRDAFVKPNGNLSDVAAIWLEQALLQRLDATPMRVQSSEQLVNQTGTASGTLGGSELAGLYRVSVTMNVRVAQGGSSVELTLGWTYGGVVRTRVFAPTLDGAVAGGEQGFVYPVQVDPGTPISYTLTYVGASLVYDATLSAELLQPIG